jgi:hypothetical protein
MQRMVANSEWRVTYQYFGRFMMEIDVLIFCVTAKCARTKPLDLYRPATETHQICIYYLCQMFKGLERRP